MPRCARAARGCAATSSPATAAPPPAVKRQDAGDRTRERRLAGAVVADETDDLARVHAELEAVQRDRRAEPLLEGVSFDHAQCISHKHMAYTSGCHTGWTMARPA